MTDLLIINTNVPEGGARKYLAASKGVWSEIGDFEAEGMNLQASTVVDGPAAQALIKRLNPHRLIDAQGQLLSPPFVDSHFHMDATLSLGLPRLNQSGTLLEGIALWGELKPHLKQEAIIERALRYCDWAVAKGLLAIRSHVDICDPRLLAVEALLDVKRKVAPYLDLQLVAFPQDGVLRYQPSSDDANGRDSAFDLLKKALDLGVDVVGGIPHFERTMAEGAASVRLLCEEAAKRGLRVDMHCDETDDPMSRHIETLIFETQRLGLQGRVNGSHLTSMHSMDNYYVSKLLPLMREAGVSATANPLINITIQGRHDTYPKRRGMTRVPEMMAQGITVSFGHDCAMDPWYSLGSADMLEVAQMGLHVAQMTGQAAMRQCFAAVTENPAKILGLEGYGLKPGCRADAVLLQAQDPVEAIRLRATRLFVIRAGQVIAEATPSLATLNLTGRPKQVDWRFQSSEIMKH
jgi:cytosine/creatinine deaminase